MGILTDLASAIETYPRDHLTLEIVEVNPAVGDSVNEDEDIQFDIQVTNSGPLDVKDLTILVSGLQGTSVKANGGAATWVPSFTTSANAFPLVPAHGNPVVSIGSPYHFKAPTAVSSRGLVLVSVAGWDTDFLHMQVSHSRADRLADASYAAEVFPR